MTSKELSIRKSLKKKPVLLEVGIFPNGSWKMKMSYRPALTTHRYWKRHAGVPTSFPAFSPTTNAAGAARRILETVAWNCPIFATLACVNFHTVTLGATTMLAFSSSSDIRYSAALSFTPYSHKAARVLLHLRFLTRFLPVSALTLQPAQVPNIRVSSPTQFSIIPFPCPNAYASFKS